MSALHLATILPLALSSNLDNLGVGVSYGMKKINIPFASNLLIAAVTSVGTLLSIFLGQGVYLFVSAAMAGYCGGGIIMAAGVWVVFQEKLMRRRHKHVKAEPLAADTAPTGLGVRRIVAILNNPIIADRDFSGHIDLKEATALALGLTINNIPNGVGVGMLGCGAMLMTSSVFLFSLMTIWVGITGGHCGFKWLGERTGLISGLVLIGVGLYEVVF